MPSYVVTGASRGIGFEFVRQLSLAKHENQIFALVRNKATATKLIALAAKNVHIIQTDITDHKGLEAAAAEVSRVTGGKLDVLINNAAYVSKNAAIPLDGFDQAEDLGKELRDAFEANIIGVIYTINAFLPLLKAGSSKKIITLSTGISDPDFLHATGLYQAAPYTISKAAVNMVVTKYAIQYKDDGFVFLALSPGLVNTAEVPLTPEELANYNGMVAMGRKIKPGFEGAITTEESVKAQLRVIHSVTVKDTGAFISHHGNKDWL